MAKRKKSAERQVKTSDILMSPATTSSKSDVLPDFAEPTIDEFKIRSLDSKKNYLSELGYKIFLDRYAQKDMLRTTFEVGDKVIVCIDRASGQREIGHILEIIGNLIKIELLDGKIDTFERDFVDKPIEQYPEEMMDRVAKGIATVEKTKEKQKEWTAKFRWLMNGWKFVPAGRILTAAGTDQQLTYYNCYVLPSPRDSRAGIVETLNNMMEVMSRGGGAGINLSSLRPRHAYVKSVNGRSSGAVSWGSIYSFATGLIEQGGSRRGALMLILNCWHPDLLEFIECKRKAGQIVNANISVGITDDFMAAVQNDEDWQLVFPDTADPKYDHPDWSGDIEAYRKLGGKIKVYKTIKARLLWNKIIESAWASAEPGIFFIDRYNKMSNSYYYNRILCTNPCGEQGLPAWGVCNLAAINLAKFADDENVNWPELGIAIKYAVRFLDNVIEATPYFFEENKKLQHEERRIGLNTMGLAEMMIKLKIRYGSKKSSTFIDKLYKFISETAYLASVELAKEKGSFPKFEKKIIESGYLRQMSNQVRSAIKNFGLRNVTILTQAPNGTIGTMVGTSTGIEPFFSWEYFRKSRLGTHKEEVDIVKKWRSKNDGKQLPDYFVTAMDLKPEQHIEVQAAIQRWIDSSISKTCNVPESYTVEQVGKLYELMYQKGCKGGTIYRDKSREEQILSLVDQDEEKGEKTKVVIKEIAPQPKKRPPILTGQTEQIPTGMGNLWVTINEDKSGQMFEVFASIGKSGGDESAMSEAIGRLISLALKSGIKIDNIIEQLQGIRGSQPVWQNGELVLSCPDGISKALKRYVERRNTLTLGWQDKEKTNESDIPEDKNQLEIVENNNQEIKIQKKIDANPKNELGYVCPRCSIKMVRAEGCFICQSCGYSKCG